WRPEDLGGPLLPPEVRRPDHEPVYRSVALSLNVYVFLQFVLLLILSAAALSKAARFGNLGFIGFAAFVTLGLVVLAGLLEGRRWAAKAEFARVVLSLILLATLGPQLVVLFVGHA
ncbi:MAG: hypothetical protein ABI672_15700, partial [Vicinamibacteria bacterium]